MSRKQNKNGIGASSISGGLLVPIGADRGKQFYKVIADNPYKTDSVYIGPNNKNGLAVDNGEIIETSPSKVRVASADLGVSNLVERLAGRFGLSNAFNTAFNKQEQFKRINKLNDDGSKHARLGKDDNKPSLIKKAINDVVTKSKEVAEKVATKVHDNAESRSPKASRRLYQIAKYTSFGDKPIRNFFNALNAKEITPDNVFLETQEQQEKDLAKVGFTKSNEDYGLVNKAVQNYKKATGKEVPVYKIGTDDITRDRLIPLSNDAVQTYSVNVGEKERLLGDAAAYPVRLYRNPETNNLYYKAWDFLDHGDYSRSNYTKNTDEYITKKLSQRSRKYGNLMDKAGNPFVKTTGYRQIDTTDNLLMHSVYEALRQGSINENDDETKALINQKIKEGFYDYNNINNPRSDINRDKLMYNGENNGIIEYVKDDGSRLYVDSRLQYGGTANKKQNMITKQHTPSTGNRKRAVAGTETTVYKQKAPFGSRINSVFNQPVDWANIINLGVNTVGNIISHGITNRAIKKLTFEPQPIAQSAAKLKTSFNINPTLAEIDNTIVDYERGLNNNVASSQTRNARTQQFRKYGIDAYNKAYAQKENTETQLINQDRLNTQSIEGQNLERYLRWNKELTDFNNQKILSKAKNDEDMVIGIGNAMSNSIQQGAERRRDKEINAIKLASAVLANPDVVQDKQTKKMVADFISGYLRDGVAYMNRRRCGGSKTIKRK